MFKSIFTELGKIQLWNCPNHYLTFLVFSGYTCVCNSGYYGNGTLGFCDPICIDESIYSDGVLTDFNNTTCRSFQPNRPDGGIIYSLTPNTDCYSGTTLSTFNVTLTFKTAEKCGDLNRVVYTSEPNDQLYVPNYFCGLKTTPCTVVTSGTHQECSLSCECVNYPIPQGVCQILVILRPNNPIMGSMMCDIMVS